MKNILLICVLGLISLFASANNVQISNLNKSGSTITFDLTWENSWHVGPDYHDAVWIFVKQAANGGPSWQHVNSFLATVDPGYETLVPSDKVGFFVKRTEDGNGIASTSVNILATGLIGAFQDVKVFGIEMVYVPSGPFYAGDGYNLGITRGDDPSESVHITSNNTLTCGNTDDDFDYNWSSCTEDIPTTYPIGYNEFYSMKYTITQGQYAEFLNCLGRTQQENRVVTDITGTSVTNYYVLCDNTVPTKGNVLRCDENIGEGPVTFYCDRNNNGILNEADDGMYRSCNYIDVVDWMAYLDWSGLRPYSFLEIEKASRGPNIPVQNEKSWGSTAWVTPGTLENAGTSTEKWSNSHIDAGISTYLGDVVRVGCNAPASGASRELSNASFYGIIDLGNNPGDFYIPRSFVSSYTAIEGDGKLNGDGEANVATWPDLDPSIAHATKRCTSNTGISDISLGTSANSSGAGGRGVRSNF